MGDARRSAMLAALRLLVPQIDDVLLAFLPHCLLRLPVPSAATANGQLLMFRRGAYGDLVGARMYVGYADSVRGFGKNLRAAAGRGGPRRSSAWRSGSLSTPRRVAPQHRPRRCELSPHFSARALAVLEDRLAAVAEARRPHGDFEALSWSAALVQDMLNVALFGGALPDGLLSRFLRPLHHRLPVPMLPRPRVFRRLEVAIAAALADPAPDSIAARLAAGDTRPGGSPAEAEAVENLRVALAAGYDTTSHTLAWAAWHLARHPQWRDPQALLLFLDEILRRYPAGWLGSRIAARDSVAAGVPVPAGTLVLYSPYLTHTDPSLWEDPLLIRPERFTAGHPAWSYLPFAAGPRTCLGAHLASLILRTALTPLARGDLAQVSGNPAFTVGITLRPRGPLHLRAR